MNRKNSKSSFDTWIEKYTRGIIRKKWWVLLTTIVAVFAIAFGARNLQIANDYRYFFEEDYERLVAYDKLQKIYTKADNILFVVTPEDGGVFNKDVLPVVEELTRKAWQIPYSIRVNSVTNFQHTEANEDNLVVEDLVEDAENFTKEEIIKARRVALQDPLLADQLISDDASVTGVNVTLQYPRESMQEIPAVVNHARKLVKQIETAHPNIEIRLTGFTMLDNAFTDAGSTDMMTLVPLMYGLMLIIMIFALRSLSGTIGTFLVITLSVMAAMGAAGYYGIYLTPPSMAAPTIIMTLAIADSIHILITFLQEMRSGSTKYEALVESMRINFQPVMLTSLTTALGFLSLNFSKIPPIAHLGNITAVGITAAFLISVTFLPAFMAIVPVKVKVGRESEAGLMGLLANFVIRYNRPLLWTVSASVLFAAAFIPENELDDRFVEYFDESVTFRKDTDYTMENLTGVYTIEFSLDAEGTNGITDPAYLRKVDEFTGWYQQQPNVMNVNSFTTIIKRLNMNMHADDSTYYRIPESRQLAAQYLLLYEMSLPYGLDLNNQINVDKSATRFTVTLDNISASEVVNITERGEQWLRDNGLPNMAAYGASPAVMFSNISGINIRSMMFGGIGALFLISIILIFALRSIKIGLISLVPNLVPIAVGFGVWGMSNGVINIGLSMVFGVTMGIVVDDTIHFLSKYLRARREKGYTTTQAIHYAFTKVGVALLVTTIILMIGFSVLAFSAFAMNSGMGQLTAITIGIALITDFLLLPPILMMLEGSKQPVEAGGEVLEVAVVDNK